MKTTQLSTCYLICFLGVSSLFMSCTKSGNNTDPQPATFETLLAGTWDFDSGTINLNGKEEAITKSLVNFSTTFKADHTWTETATTGNGPFGGDGTWKAYDLGIGSTASGTSANSSKNRYSFDMNIKSGPSAGSTIMVLVDDINGNTMNVSWLVSKTILKEVWVKR